MFYKPIQCYSILLWRSELHLDAFFIVDESEECHLCVVIFEVDYKIYREAFCWHGFWSADPLMLNAHYAT